MNTRPITEQRTAVRSSRLIGARRPIGRHFVRGRRIAQRASIGTMTREGSSSGGHGLLSEPRGYALTCSPRANR